MSPQDNTTRSRSTAEVGPLYRTKKTGSGASVPPPPQVGGFRRSFPRFCSEISRSVRQTDFASSGRAMHPTALKGPDLKTPKGNLHAHDSTPGGHRSDNPRSLVVEPTSLTYLDTRCTYGRLGKDHLRRACRRKSLSSNVHLIATRSAILGQSSSKVIRVCHLSRTLKRRKAQPRFVPPGTPGMLRRPLRLVLRIVSFCQPPASRCHHSMR